MNNVIIYLACLVLLSLQTYGQTSGSRNVLIIWDRQSNCSGSNAPEALAKPPVCKRVETDQGTFYITTYEGISVAISYVFPRSYIRATVQVTNRSGIATNFDPGESQVDVFDSKSTFLKGMDKSRLSKNITADDAKALYIKSQADLKIFSPDSVAPLAPSNNLQIRATTRTYTSVNGHVASVVKGAPSTSSSTSETATIAIEPDSPAADPPSRAVPSRPNGIENSSLTLFDRGIKAGSIPNGQKTAGYMFFELVENPVRYLVFRIKVGSLVFIFPEETSKDLKKLRK
jgi:hypothetical protein